MPGEARLDAVRLLQRARTRPTRAPSVLPLCWSPARRRFCARCARAEPALISRFFSFDTTVQPQIHLLRDAHAPLHENVALAAAAGRLAQPRAHHARGGRARELGLQYAWKPTHPRIRTRAHARCDRGVAADALG